MYFIFLNASFIQVESFGNAFPIDVNCRCDVGRSETPTGGRKKSGKDKGEAGNKKRKGVPDEGVNLNA